MLPVLVKTQAGLPISAPPIHSEELPIPEILHWVLPYYQSELGSQGLSLCSLEDLNTPRMGDPSAGIDDSVASQTVDTEGTVLILAVLLPGTGFNSFGNKARQLFGCAIAGVVQN
jgi:hypothetical protein